ncbi:MAG TPA: hypothetical protein VG406_27380 [Isosphaeraceae bacterium]|jgi:hypothetical protein|nr:hypothetical protein [Isosphaeraceae bacterium]
MMAIHPTLRRPRGLRLTIAAAMALVGVAALVFGHFRPKTDAERLATMGDDVREAVVRDLAGRMRKGEIVFLSFEDRRDPTDAFLARVVGLPCRVRKLSAAPFTMTHGSIGFYIETTYGRDTGEPRVAALIEIRRWISDSEVEVSLMRSGDQTGERDDLKLKWTDSAWRVTGKSVVSQWAFPSPNWGSDELP